MYLKAILGSRCFAVFLTLASAADMCSAQDGHSPRLDRKKFGEMVGLGVKFSQGQPLTELPMLLDLRVRWVRENLWWRDIEPEPGRIAPLPAYLKKQLDFYREHDIGFIALLSLENDRAYPATMDDPGRPYDPEHFARFAVSVARMLKAEGVRFVLELGNEPHNSSIRKVMGGEWNGKGPAPWVKHYVQMVSAAVTLVKAYDPAIRILSNDDMWVVHYWFLEAGLPTALDGFAVHPYTQGIPEQAAVEQDTEWTKPFQVVDADRSFGSAVRRLRERGLTRLGKVPSIWVTEWGWPVGDGSRGTVAEDELVAYLPRAYILAAAAGVEVLCWFSSQDSVDGPMGLTRNDLGRRKSYQAFRTLTAQLADSVFQRQVAGFRDKTLGLQAFLFASSSGSTLAVWSADKKKRRMTLPTGALFSATDAIGVTFIPSTDNSTTTSVLIDATPIFVHGPWTDDTIAAAIRSAER